MKIDLKDKEDLLNFFSAYIDREVVIHFKEEEGGYPKVAFIYNTYNLEIPVGNLEYYETKTEEFAQKFYSYNILENYWKLLHYFIEKEIPFIIDNKNDPTIILKNATELIHIIPWDNFYSVKKRFRHQEKEVFYKEIKTFDYLTEILNELNKPDS